MNAFLDSILTTPGEAINKVALHQSLNSDVLNKFVNLYKAMLFTYKMQFNAVPMKLRPDIINHVPEAYRGDVLEIANLNKLSSWHSGNYHNHFNLIAKKLKKIFKGIYGDDSAGRKLEMVASERVETDFHNAIIMSHGSDGAPSKDANLFIELKIGTEYSGVRFVSPIADRVSELFLEI